MKKKNSNWLAWLVAIILVVTAAGSYVYIKHEEGIREVKLTKQKKKDERNAKINLKMMKKQVKELRKPLDWTKPSETVPYPNIKKYRHASKLKRIWLSYSIKDQRLYVHQGPFTIYTMYGYGNPNYQTMDNKQKTPLGIFKIKKSRGSNYNDAPSNQKFLTWIEYSNPTDPYGVQSMLTTVPVNEKGEVNKKALKSLGKSYKKKHVAKTNGAIWLTEADAQWIKQNIPAKTILIIQSQNDTSDPYRKLEDYYDSIEIQSKYAHKQKKDQKKNED